MLERRALHDGFGDDSGRYGGASSISPSFKALSLRGRSREVVTPYVAETKRTRGGVDSGTGQKTRPYRFGEVDILAVCLQPSTGNWKSFMYTVGDWLLPRPDDPTLFQVLQPVATAPNAD